MPIGRKKNKYGVALNKPCEWCYTINNLSRHHVKNRGGIKTGEIMILCRECHDMIEEQYKAEGRLGKHTPFDEYNVRGCKTKYTTRNNVTYDSLIPFHARGKV